MPSTGTVRHRSLWISDVHLGSPNCKARSLAAFLKRNHCEQLYLVGDILDGWKLKTHFHWTADQSRVIEAVLAKARRGTEVYYITGNHDAFLRQFLRRPLRLGRFRLVNEVVHTTADGRRLLVMHGDAFDEVVAAFPRLSYLGDRAYEGLISVNRRMNRAAAWLGLGQWSLSSAAKTLVKGAVQNLSGFDEKVLFRCREERLHGVICGHTHHAEMRHLRNGIISYNCGDWVESCTALAEDFSGCIRLLTHDSVPQRLARPVSSRPAVVQHRLPPRAGLAPRSRAATARRPQPVEVSAAAG
jgi:UDP-2,3-diacylglucosamine pyrophosphatase LpxH